MLPYVPALLSDWRPTHGDERHMRVEGSLAFVDISGFTKLTERLARRGNVGAEARLHGPRRPWSVDSANAG